MLYLLDGLVNAKLDGIRLLWFERIVNMTRMRFVTHASGWDGPIAKMWKTVGCLKKNKGVASRKLTWQWNINQVLIGDTSSNGCFSVVTLVFGGVILGIWLGCWNSCRWILQSRHPQMFETIPHLPFKGLWFHEKSSFQSYKFPTFGQELMGTDDVSICAISIFPPPEKNPSIA